MNQKLCCEHLHCVGYYSLIRHLVNQFGNDSKEERYFLVNQLYINYKGSNIILSNHSKIISGINFAHKINTDA